jgi:hypothetical protein
MTAADCAAVPGFQADAGPPVDGGWWYDGYIGGNQFELLGIVIEDATAPAGFTVSTDSTTVLAFSLSGATIDPGIDNLLTEVSFSGFTGSSICFGEYTDSSGDMVISDAGKVDGYGKPHLVSWGDCFCPDNNPADECGVCGCV